MSEPAPLPGGTGERPPLDDQIYREVVGKICMLICPALAQLDSAMRDFGIDVASREGATKEENRAIARQAADLRNKLDVFVRIIDPSAGAEVDGELYRRVIGTA